MDLLELQKRIEQMETLRRDFRKELLALLKKYNATISYDYSVDSCSGALMSDEMEVVSDNKELKESFTLLVVNGKEITIHDLEGY